MTGPGPPGGPAAGGGSGGGAGRPASSRGAAVLRAEDVVVRYGGEAVVEIGGLELREGELLVLLGPNGAGKSTLMRVLAMLEAPDEGRVLYRGAGGDAAEEALREASTAVFQRPHLWSGTVAGNLRLGLRLAGVAGDEAEGRLRATAQALGLEDLVDRDVGDLSAGQVQRVALARALAPDPGVLFLDEPTANLDAGARRALRRDVSRFARRGGRATLLITHDRREAFRLADRIAVLEDGRLVRAGSPRAIYERPGSPYVARVSGAELTLRGRVAPGDAAAGAGDAAGGDREEGGGTSDRARGEGGAEAADRGPERLLRVDVDGVRLLAVGRAAPGDEVTVAYRPEDLALAEAPAGGDRPTAGREDAPGAAVSDGRAARAERQGAAETPTGAVPPDGAGRDSVRNSFPATVEELRDVRGLVRVGLRGPPDVVAAVTRGSADALGLRPGDRVRVRVKAAALHAFPR